MRLRVLTRASSNAKEVLPPAREAWLPLLLRWPRNLAVSSLPPSFSLLSLSASSFLSHFSFLFFSTTVCLLPHNWMCVCICASGHVYSSTHTRIQCLCLKVYVVPRKVNHVTGKTERGEEVKRLTRGGAEVTAMSLLRFLFVKWLPVIVVDNTYLLTSKYCPILYHDIFANSDSETI